MDDERGLGSLAMCGIEVEIVVVSFAVTSLFASRNESFFSPGDMFACAVFFSVRGSRLLGREVV